MEIMDSVADVSICVATYNRAPQLAQVLEHFLTFKSLNFELVVGDNASTDETQEIVRRYAGKFPQFTYKRHASNIGMVGNFNAVNRLARGKYVYGHCDDDMAFEGALLLMKKILDTYPSIVGINGAYLPSTKLDVGMDQDYEAAQIMLIPKGDYMTLANNLMVYDGAYMMRRETAQRHLFAPERSVGGLPLTARLLSMGDVAHVIKPVLQHFHTPDSQSTKLAEGWFQDGGVGDIESSFADAAAMLPAGTVERVRHNWNLNVYLQAARMARIHRDYSDVWYFLQRLKGIGGVDEACLVQCENAFLTEVALLKIARIAYELGACIIAVEDTPLMIEVQRRLSERLPDVEWKSVKTAEHVEADLHLMALYDTVYAQDVAAGLFVALVDVLAANRLTAHHLNIGGGADTGLWIEFTGDVSKQLLEQESHNFQVIMTEYAIV